MNAPPVRYCGQNATPPQVSRLGPRPFLNHSSHHLRGAVFVLQRLPRVRKNAYTGLMFLHAFGVRSPKDCMEISPAWSVLRDTRGYSLWEDSHPGGVRGSNHLFVAIV